MSTNRNIGFFKGIVETVRGLSYKNNNAIQPVARIADQTTDYNTLKNIASVKDSDGSDNTFHWGFHKWGDNSHLVSK